MDKQIIVTLGREFGSGGHYIAKLIAQELGIRLFDKELLEAIVKTTGYSAEMLEKYDEKPRNFFLSRRIGNYSNSLEENIANKVFDLIREEAAKGVSFVVVGRCGGYILKDEPNAVRVFVLADMEAKTKRIMKLYSKSENEAVELIKETDKKRKTYHNYYSDMRWGDSRGYDISINSSKLGLDKTAEFLTAYIKSRVDAEK